MSLIVRVEQRGNSVRAYGAGNCFLWARNGQLISYTATEVSIYEAGTVYVYNERGHVIRRG